MLCSLINRSYVLDLPPGRSLIEKLTREGFDVYISEWETPEPESRFVSAPADGGAGHLGSEESV